MNDQIPMRPPSTVSPKFLDLPKSSQLIRKIRLSVLIWFVIFIASNSNHYKEGLNQDPEDHESDSRGLGHQQKQGA